MLNGTKIEATECIKFVAEGIQNDLSDLKNTCNTFAGLNPILGYDYFRGNISHRGRYETLASDLQYMSFIMTACSYLKKRGSYDKNADFLLADKEAVIRFLKRNKCTLRDLTGH
jgi:hypothetical protein